MWLVLSFAAAAALVSAVEAEWTTHSPLTAFKQLGFDYNSGGQHNGQQSAPYIPYSISDFEDGSNSRISTDSKSRTERFQEIRHPNDIMTNMGVDLPTQQILGKLLNFKSKQKRMAAVHWPIHLQGADIPSIEGIVLGRKVVFS
jgi:hypothetical protein